MTIIALLGSIIAHEAGHLLCGLLTGYRFLSFRIGPLVWARMGDKIRFKINRNYVKHIVGQCLMRPPEKKEDFRFTLCLLGGGIFNLLLAALCLTVLFLSPLDSLLRTSMLPWVILNTWLGIANLKPMDCGVPNDGMNVREASKSPQAAHGLYLTLYCNDQLMQGKRYRELDQELFTVDPGADANNYFVFLTLAHHGAYLYDQRKYEESVNIFKQYDLDLNKLPPFHRNLCNASSLYHYCVHQPDHAAARQIYESKGMGKFLQAGLPSLCRIDIAYKLFVENDIVQAQTLLQKTRQDLKNSENPGLIRMETDELDMLEAAITARLPIIPA